MGKRNCFWFYLQDNELYTRPVLLSSTTLPNKEDYASIFVSSTQHLFFRRKITNNSEIWYRNPVWYSYSYMPSSSETEPQCLQCSALLCHLHCSLVGVPSNDLIDANMECSLGEVVGPHHRGIHPRLASRLLGCCAGMNCLTQLNEAFPR